MDSEVTNQVYFDFSIDGEDAGRIVIGPLPKRQLYAQAEKGLNIQGIPMTYKESSLHRKILDFMIQGADFTNDNGTRGKSINGRKFPINI